MLLVVWCLQYQEKYGSFTLLYLWFVDLVSLVSQMTFVIGMGSGGSDGGGGLPSGGSHLYWKILKVTRDSEKIFICTSLFGNILSATPPFSEGLYPPLMVMDDK